MLGGISVGNLSELLSVALALIVTIINILVYLANKRTVKLHRQEVNHQIANSHSSAQHQIVDAHRDIFFGILNNSSLLKSFTEANGLDAEDWELKKLSSFLINQVMIEHLNFQNEIVNPRRFEGFKRDAQDVFAYKTVCSHWQTVRQAHSKEFRQFVEAELLPQDLQPIPTKNSRPPQKPRAKDNTPETN